MPSTSQTDRSVRRSPKSEQVGTPAIRSSNLTKQYGDVTAVDGLNFSIPSGVVYGFLGPNGSGKTTTMRMLTTLTKPTSGSASIVGIDVSNRSAVIDHIGYLPEQPPIYDELTGREQLQHVAALHDIPRSEATERITGALDRFGLTGQADRHIEGYSKGMRQKLGVIQAILHEPEVIFLDEPTSGLDPRAARTVRDLIAELAAEDRTIFLSTHILSVVDELADEVGVIHHGRLVAEGPPEALKNRAETGEEQSLEDVFLAVTEDQETAYEAADNATEPASGTESSGFFGRF